VDGDRVVIVHLEDGRGHRVATYRVEGTPSYHYSRDDEDLVPGTPQIVVPPPREVTFTAERWHRQLPTDAIGARRGAMEPATIGVAPMLDDTGLAWLAVVVATDYGDAVFEVFPDNRAAGNAIAEAHADHLVELFGVLGIPAERGDVGTP
jgi:hypothetical protein